MPTVFRGPGPSKKVKMVKISGGTGGSGGRGGVIGGEGGIGEGPRVKIGVARTVTNIIKNYSTAPAVPSGFRSIPLGDIDLQREIHFDRRSGVASLRKLHSAKILAERADVTVASYQGDGAAEEWQRDIQKYMAIRHPNIVQLYGTARYGNIYATVFHDDLIPLQHFEDLYKHSHFSSMYIHVYVRIEFQAVYDYFWTIFRHPLWEQDCTFFIRRSTGRLCLDLVPSGRFLVGQSAFVSMPTQQGLEFLAGENSDATVIDSLPLEQYHTISYSMLSVFRFLSISSSVTANLGGVLYYLPDDTSNDVIEIAWLPNAELSSDPSWFGTGNVPSFGELMPDGWTRIVSDDAVNGEFLVGWWLEKNHFWLSQAHHIFSTLQISSNFEDYVVLKEIWFTFIISTVEGATPTGFLFLCPPKYFQTGPSSFRWPDCPAYWSLDHSGAERIAPEDAANLGFPSFSISTEIKGYSWDGSVYAGIRRFHAAKGFDPDSQDVARHLGHPLYQWSDPNRIQVSFAHIDDEDSPHRDRDDTDQVDVAASIHTDAEEMPVSRPLEGIVDSTRTDYDLIAASTHQDAEETLVSNPFEEIVEAIPTDLADLAATSTHPDLEEMPVSSTSEEIVDLTLANADPEEVPLSSTFKFVLNVHLSLILVVVLFSVLSEI
ncbi:hypothetical protein MSAN_00307400 [Mycena sanguinolenta]|uniref:Protein kinase domain-containing protein n=1 Tax=Mycena sanguinolenta TaxID=230812 RepID=A0A8H7DH86_9AGAR|nr:hypothetical protein MSAN_00307400 [Mycena sanguinolenta]